MVGRLSDRAGRKRLLALIYLAVAAGLLALSASVSLWHFWAASSLIAVSNASLAVRNALVTDLVPAASLGKGISLLSAAAYAAGIFGFAATGQAIDLWGPRAALLAGAALPLIATLLLIPIREPRRQEAA